MACNYVFLSTALDDLNEVAAYLSAATGSDAAADSFLEEAQQVIELTCEFPILHAVSRMPELAEKGYRVALAGSYALLYTFEQETIYIAHVFHQRQDYAHMV